MNLRPSIVAFLSGAMVGLAAAADELPAPLQLQTRVDPAGDVQTMLWSRGRAAQVGFGVGVSPQLDGSGDRSIRLGVSVSRLAPSRLIWQIGSADSDVPGRAGVPINFTKPSSSKRLGLRSTLRYDIDSRTTITVKPRRSRISVTYSHQW